MYEIHRREGADLPMCQQGWNNVFHASCWILDVLYFVINWITLLVGADARRQGVKDDQIVFTDVAMKNEHIRRGALADLFLDT